MGDRPFDLLRLAQEPRIGRRARRRGPRPAVSDSEFAEAIRDLHGRLEVDVGIRGEGYRMTHARLRSVGAHVDRDRVLRVMPEHGLLCPTRLGRPQGPQVYDGRITTDRLDEMWGTDATQTLTLDEGTAWVFAAIDHCTGEIVDIHTAYRGTRFEAFEPVHQGVRTRFGEIGQEVCARLALRHKNGTQYMSRAFRDQLAFFGIDPSPNFDRSPEGYGVAERFMRILKELLLWIRNFRTVEELRRGLLDFKCTYNESWILARHGYRTPNQARSAPVAAA